MRSEAKASSAGSRRRIGKSKPALLLCVLAAAVAAFALVVGSASGATTRFLVEVFGSSAQPAFSNDCGLAFDQSSDPYPEAAPCVPGPGGIGTGTSPVSVEAGLSGLQPGTTYVYRLRATYPSGPVTAGTETVRALGPAILGTWSADVVFTEAILKAQINPAGKATTYHFEYGPTEAYGSETPELAVGSDNTAHELTRFLEGLRPGTTYHFRVVATNADATSFGPDVALTTYERFVRNTECPNQAFRVGPSANLPDCRAYEMVSPIDKNGGDIDGRSGEFQASVEGGKLAYSSKVSFGDAISAFGRTEYISTRGAAGWTTHAIAPPIEADGDASASLENGFLTATPDLSSAWYENDNVVPLTPDAQTSIRQNGYRRDNLTDSFEALTVNPTTNVGNGKSLELLRGYSQDMSHQVFEARATETLEANTSAGERKAYDFSGGELHLVGILPDGSPNPISSIVGGAPSGSTINGQNHAVSADGSRIFWWSSTGFTREKGTLFVRLNPAEGQSALSGEECIEPDKACTVQLAPGSESRFIAATPDGSQALVRVGDTLSRIDVDSLTETPVAGELPERYQGFSGSGAVLGSSEDLSRVYFVSREDLAPGATAGEANLYLDDEGAKTFVGPLSEQDIGQVGQTRFASVTSLQQTDRLSAVSADGGHVIFAASSRRLALSVGYDNTDAVSGKADFEVYLYAAGGDVRCISCNPSGARPEGAPVPGTFGTLSAAGLLPTGVVDSHTLSTNHAISEDGQRAFFHSFDALVPHDTNGAQDVYQWQAPGAGECTAGSSTYSELNGGCVGLISTGTSAEESKFFDATPDGRDAYFLTGSSLDPRDPGSLDVYDARQGGGLPLPPAPPGCIGDACQSVPPAPAHPAPASAAFRGAGDPVARRSCAPAARRAVRLSRRAKRLRRVAGRAAAAKRKRAMRRRATGYAKRAKRLSRAAKRCRRAGRRTGR